MSFTVGYKMIVEKRIGQMQWRNILSGLWIYFLLSILFRDVHEFLRVGYLEQVMTGVVNGNPITEEILLYAGLGLQIPLIMTVLPRFLGDVPNRWSNMIASTLMLVPVVGFVTDPDMDDVLFLVGQVLALCTIFLIAWRVPHVASG